MLAACIIILTFCSKCCSCLSDTCDTGLKLWNVCCSDDASVETNTGTASHTRFTRPTRRSARTANLSTSATASTPAWMLFLRRVSRLFRRTATEREHPNDTEQPDTEHSDDSSTDFYEA